MIAIDQLMDETVAGWNAIGHPEAGAMMRFVRRQGRAFEAYKLPPRHGYGTLRRVPKECFQNAYQLADRRGLTYVEGYAVIRDIPHLIHHAWAWDAERRRIVEPTLRDNTGYSYYGIDFPPAEVRAEMARLGYYGILAPGDVVNGDLIQRRDPELWAALVKEVPRLDRRNVA